MDFWLHTLPAINACFNGLGVLFLSMGFLAIRYKKVIWHRYCMLGALSASALFLVGYLARVVVVGTHQFPHVGWIRSFYLALLISHMILAVVILPLIARTFFLAFKGRFSEHRLIARITWPLWMYVSTTGVIVYWMLYHLAPRLITLKGSF